MGGGRGEGEEGREERGGRRGEGGEGREERGGRRGEEGEGRNAVCIHAPLLVELNFSPTYQEVRMGLHPNAEGSR